MNGGSAFFDDIRAALQPHGIMIRGVVNFSAGEAGPLLSSGRSASSVMLFGNIGGSIWASFDAWHGADRNEDFSNPLDTWSKAVILPLAAYLGATAYFPSDKPWQPFQQWAMRAEGLRASPLGILIHPEYGLWHGYRGALAFADVLPTETIDGSHPCDACLEKPCLSHCPVNAVTPGHFDVAQCRSHLGTDEGKAGCIRGGCDARNACPIGIRYRYPEAQRRFHMAALSGV